MTITNVYFTEIDSAWDIKISEHKFDVSHLSGWVNVSSVIEEGRPQGVIAEYDNKMFFLPFIKREINSEYWDAISPSGYGGPVIDARLIQGEIDTILVAVKEFLSNAGCVSIFARLNPILNQEWSSVIGTAVTHGFTLISDLSKTKEALWEETQNQHRRGIKKALKMNIVAKVESFTDERIKAFSEIYRENMIKVGALDYYFFDDSYLDLLSTNLNERLLLVTAYDDSKAVASSIYTICKESGLMQFYLGGTLNHYRNLQPSKLIMHTAREWGQENGYNALNLGSGVCGRADSLYDYKKGFSSTELEFKTWRLIVNIEKYNQLVLENAALTDIERQSDYFPLYRNASGYSEAVLAVA